MCCKRNWENRDLFRCAIQEILIQEICNFPFVIMNVMFCVTSINFFLFPIAEYTLAENTSGVNKHMFSNINICWEKFRFPFNVSRGTILGSS